MTVAPIVMAAIRNTPPNTSQRIGPPRTKCLKLKEAVPFAVIGLDRCQALIPEVVSHSPGPQQWYCAGMEDGLAIWVNDGLIGGRLRLCEARCNYLSRPVCSQLPSPTSPPRLPRRGC